MDPNSSANSNYLQAQVLIEGGKVTGPGSTFIWTFTWEGTFLGSNLTNVGVWHRFPKQTNQKKSTIIQILSGINIS